MLEPALVDFNPTADHIGCMDERSDDELKNEPMLYSASPEFAMEHGGPLTEEFLTHVPMEDGWVIDSKVVMLKPGWMPAIGGWHCDAVRRPNGQPDFSATPDTDEHIVAVIGEPRIIWITEPITLIVPREGKVWPTLSRQLEAMTTGLGPEPGLLTTGRFPDRSVIKFGTYDLHRTQVAEESGWRFFIRASKANHRPHNEIRRQVQVYVESEMAGW